MDDAKGVVVGDTRVVDAKIDENAKSVDAKAKRARRRGGILPPPVLTELILSESTTGGEEIANETKNDVEPQTTTDDFELDTPHTDSLTIAFGRMAELELKIASLSEEKKYMERDMERLASSAEAAAREAEERIAAAVAEAVAVLTNEKDKALQEKDVELSEKMNALNTAWQEVEANISKKNKMESESSDAPPRVGKKKENPAAGREVDVFRREIDTLKKDLSRHKEKAIAAEAKYRLAAQEKAAAVAGKSVTEKELRRVSQKNEAGDKLSDKKEKALDLRCERLSVSVDTMKVTLAALEKENKRLVSTSKELEKGLENARLAKETAEAVLDPLRVELAASKQSQKEHETKAEQAAVAAEVAAADATDARAALGTLHRVRAELEEARAETVTAKKTLVQKDKEIGAELRETQRRLAEWCAAAATTDSELESCKKQLSETQSELVKLRQSVDGIKKKRASAEIDAADAHASFQSAREKLSALEKNVESVSTELIATKEALAQANSLTDQLTQQAKVAKTENDTITNSVADLEMILEEAVGRAEEETARRHELELELAAARSGDARDILEKNAVTNLLKKEQAAVQKMTLKIESMTRRAVRAEDRLHETEKQLARARAEVLVGGGVSGVKSKSGAGSFTEPDLLVAASAGVPNQTQKPNPSSQPSAEDTTSDELTSLREELKQRTRQTHKLQEVCAGLRKTFLDAGGEHKLFDLGKALSEARYETKKAEQKRLAERTRAEALVGELENTKRALAKLQGTNLGLTNQHGASNAGAASLGKQTFLSLSSSSRAPGGENLAPRGR